MAFQEKKVYLNEHYQDIVGFIIEEMNKEQLPWRQPWFNRIPTNLYTRKPYRGINVLCLNARAHLRGYQSEYWVTENQARRLGGSIKPEELQKGNSIIMARWAEREWKDRSGVLYKEVWLVTRSYKVYNFEQTQGLNYPASKDQLPLFGPIDKAEEIVSKYKNRPEVTYDNARAFYNPARDIIGMPRFEQFSSPEEYYATLFHELIHSTGHEKRLKRRSFVSKVRFGDDLYAREELVAELGAAFLCCVCGFFPQTGKNSAAYIASWLKGLENTPTLLFWAASKAQAAVQYMLGTPPPRTPNEPEDETPTATNVEEGRLETEWD